MPHLRNALIAVLLCAAWSGVSAQPPMLEDSDATELIGGGVPSAEGVEVVEVSAVVIKTDGEGHGDPDDHGAVARYRSENSRPATRCLSRFAWHHCSSAAAGGDSPAPKRRCD